MSTPREKSFSEQGYELQTRKGMTKEEVEQLEQAALQFFDRLINGVCTVCGGEVTKHVQVGRCVYAEPCGHRMYQGKAKR